MLNIVNTWAYSYCWSGFLCYVMGYVAFYEERYCKRDRERDGDVFLFSKMMKFQNIKVWERWVVVCVMGVF